METVEWSCLPDHVLVFTMSCLPLHDRFHASLVCRAWNSAFHSHYLWQHFTCAFCGPEDERMIKGAAMFSPFIKSLTIELDQNVEENRSNACRLMMTVAREQRRRLRSLVVRFMGENPLFYAGKEFVEVLLPLFISPTDNGSTYGGLEHVDLSGLKVAYNDEVFLCLAKHNPHLKFLDVQNRQLVCKVSPACIRKIIEQCPELEDLRVYNCSLSDFTLQAFMEQDRKPLKHLSIICRSEEKFAKGISDEIWVGLVKRHRDLRVSLSFDHTCLLHKVAELMRPDIPVSALRLGTYTHIYDELCQAVAQYKNTLEKLVIHTPQHHNAVAFNRGLVEMAEQCYKLRSLHVFCVIEAATVERILELHPDMKERKTYTLKSTPEPHPWTPGLDC